MAALSSGSPHSHRRSHHIPRHRRQPPVAGRTAARTAVVGATGAVVMGAALGLTAGLPAADAPDRKAGESALGALLDERAEQAGSRSLGRAPVPSATVVPRGQAPLAVQPATQQTMEVPDGCEEYSGNRRIGCTILPEFGFGLEQMPALERLWDHESGWNHLAENQSTGAYGIPQALPGSKMATAGDDWQTNPATQIRWGLGYIKDRYGDPNSAWAFFQANGWY